MKYWIMIKNLENKFYVGKFNYVYKILLKCKNFLIKKLNYVSKWVQRSKMSRNVVVTEE